MLLLFSVRVAEWPPLRERAVHSVYCACLSWTFFSFSVCFLMVCCRSFVAPALAGRHRRASFRPFVHSFVRTFVRPSIRQHLTWVSCERNSFTVLHPLFWDFACVFLMVWGCACGLDIIVGSILSLFRHCELSHFSPWLCRQRVSLVSATPLTVLYQLFWNFACIFLMVWGYACGLDIIVGSVFVTFSTLWT